MSPALMVGLSGGLVMLGQISKGNAPAPRQFIGIAAAGTALLLFANSYPAAAAKYAALVLTTTLLTSGYDVAQGVNRAIAR